MSRLLSSDEASLSDPGRIDDMQWLKHAFAIEPAAAFAPTQGECELVGRLCHELCRRRLVLPASVLLESVRPLGSVASQALVFSTPWLATVTDTAGLKTLSELLARSGAVDWLLDELYAAEEHRSGPPTPVTTATTAEFPASFHPVD